MGRYARKKGKSASCKGIGKRGGKTRTRTKDLDQINEDLVKVALDKFALPGEDLEEKGQFYCASCARHFQSDSILSAHMKTKVHKQRLKKLKDWPTDM